MGERTAGWPSPGRPVTSQSLSLLTPDPQDFWTEGEPRGGPSNPSLPTADQKTFNPFTDKGWTPGQT
ncbi:hypothetical protein PBY51_011749 [Eleginops maclovinus]|uniref:Uncharacterized protein n=1 Tax=Eleginops maclovinus TaxID=56733 RepID=A0AAN8AP76_ELEMC|nr:hypothetical protein PBY51_011749 [Eleginops maclovinus]